MPRQLLYFIFLLAFSFSCDSESKTAKSASPKSAAIQDLSELELYQNYYASPTDQRQLDQNAIIDYVSQKEISVHRLPSGVYRSIDSLGQGEEVLYNKPVTIHYKGYTLDGKEFDNSFKKGRPMRTALGEVIDGWRRGLLGLSEGSKAKLFIPSELAYGEAGLLDIIGPNEVLVFEVEIIKVR